MNLIYKIKTTFPISLFNTSLINRKGMLPYITARKSIIKVLIEIQLTVLLCLKTVMMKVRGMMSTTSRNTMAAIRGFVGRFIMKIIAMTMHPRVIILVQIA